MNLSYSQSHGPLLFTFFVGVSFPAISEGLPRAAVGSLEQPGYALEPSRVLHYGGPMVGSWKEGRAQMSLKQAAPT